MAAILNSLQMSYQTFRLQNAPMTCCACFPPSRLSCRAIRRRCVARSSRSRPRARRSRALSPRAPTLCERKLKGHRRAGRMPRRPDAILGPPPRAGPRQADQGEREPGPARARGRGPLRACLKCALVCNNGVSPYQTRKEAHVSEKHQSAQTLHRAPHVAAFLGCHAHAAADRLSLGALVGGLYLFLLTFANTYVMALIVDRVQAGPVAGDQVFEVFGSIFSGARAR